MVQGNVAAFIHQFSRRRITEHGALEGALVHNDVRALATISEQVLRGTSESRQLAKDNFARIESANGSLPIQLFLSLQNFFSCSSRKDTIKLREFGESCCATSVSGKPQGNWNGLNLRFGSTSNPYPCERSKADKPCGSRGAVSVRYSNAGTNGAHSYGKAKQNSFMRIRWLFTMV